MAFLAPLVYEISGFEKAIAGPGGAILDLGSAVQGAGGPEKVISDIGNFFTGGPSGTQGLGGLLHSLGEMLKPPGFDMIQEAVGGVGQALGCGAGMSQNDVCNAHSPEELHHVVGNYNPPEGIYNEDQRNQINQSQQGFLAMNGQYEHAAQLIPQILGMLDSTGHENVRNEYENAKQNALQQAEYEVDNDQDIEQDQDYEIDHESEMLNSY
ncbi:hypothetical protein HDU97_003695 [Phlyctochytrium planicorne]|nr:hypothetical protein HDU97_003695 [Phlyctochytrium planicorne]